MNLAFLGFAMIIVFMALIMAKKLSPFTSLILVPVAFGLTCVGCWCDRNSRDAWDFAFWSLHAEVRQ